MKKTEKKIEKLYIFEQDGTSKLIDENYLKNIILSLTHGINQTNIETKEYRILEDKLNLFLKTYETIKQNDDELIINEYRKNSFQQTNVCIELWFDLMKNGLKPNKKTKKVLYSIIDKNYFKSIKKGFKEGKITNVNISHLKNGK